jgi:hypothetical protein
MPKKGASKNRKNNQLWVTLPDGARSQLDELVAMRVVGDSHSEVIRKLVIDQLAIAQGLYRLKLPTSRAESS